ncbi:hypothetical protein AAC978_00060 [Desulfitobacterium sp. THU1]|uniref:hypothetical protein n=1 Tax=Desulfitobacterium sp. THU1 TaxID=3138072 RepID=UPI00311EA686
MLRLSPVGFSESRVMQLHAQHSLSSSGADKRAFVATPPNLWAIPDVNRWLRYATKASFA